MVTLVHLGLSPNYLLVVGLLVNTNVTVGHQLGRILETGRVNGLTGSQISIYREDLRSVFVTPTPHPLVIVTQSPYCW